MKDAEIFRQCPGPTRASLPPVTPDEALGPPSRLRVGEQGRKLDRCILFVNLVNSPDGDALGFVVHPLPR